MDKLERMKKNVDIWKVLIILFVFELIVIFAGLLQGLFDCNSDPYSSGLKVLNTLLAFLIPVIGIVYYDVSSFLRKSEKSFEEYRGTAVEGRNEIRELIREIDYIECFDLSMAMRLMLACAIRRDGEIKSIDIFARTSAKYFSIIEELAGTAFIRGIDGNLVSKLGLAEVTDRKLSAIGEIRILLTNERVLRNFGLEPPETRWDKLKNEDGLCLCQRPVNIKFGTLISANHYAIINKKYVVEGLYKTVDPVANDALLKPFVYLDRRSRDSDILNDRLNHFNWNFNRK